VDLLLAECGSGGVEMQLNARGIVVDGRAGGFRVSSSAGEFAAGSLVVATGGLSIPKLGATGLAYDLARQFGLRLIEPRAALVPLVLGGDEARWTELAGVAADVVARADGSDGRKTAAPAFREKMLVTHRGLSGPAVLQASSYWRPGQALTIDFAPQLPAGGALLGPLLETGARRDTIALRQALHAVLPHRLAGFLAEASAPAGWSNAALEACERELRRWRFHPVGTEGFEKAEVTAGGVNTDDLQARTMEARRMPGLFFIGEAVDVTGHLGGFNFQWAWASAVAAGNAL
jgi:predicted Rossmann fold flavoprotein